MKNIRLLIGLPLLGFSCLLQAQINLTSLNMVGPGHIITEDQVEVEYEDSIQIGNVGANQVWNFTNIPTIDYPQLQIGVSPSSTPHANLFPTTTLAITDELIDSADYNYYILQNSSFAQMGYANYSETTTLTPPLKLFEFPFTYQNSFMQTAAVSGQADGISISGNAKTAVIADAYGTVSTDLGTFPCIRVKRITELTLNVSFFTLIQRDTNYEWWTNQFKAPVFTFNRNFSSLFGQEEFGGYAKVLLDQSVSAAEPMNQHKKLELQLSPNPVSEKAVLSFQLNTAGKTEWVMVNAMGKIAQRGQLGQIFPGEYTEIVPFDDIPSGIYILTLLQDGRPLGFKKVIKD